MGAGQQIKADDFFFSPKTGSIDVYSLHSLVRYIYIHFYPAMSAMSTKFPSIWAPSGKSKNLKLVNTPHHATLFAGVLQHSCGFIPTDVRLPSGNQTWENPLELEKLIAGFSHL